MDSSVRAVFLLPVVAILFAVGCSLDGTPAVGPPKFLYSDEYYNLCPDEIPASGQIPLTLAGLVRHPTSEERCRIYDALEEALASQTCGTSAFTNGLNYLFSGKFWVYNHGATTYEGVFATVRIPVEDSNGNLTGYVYDGDGFAVNENVLFGSDRRKAFDILYHEVSDSGHAGDVEQAWVHQNDGQHTPYHQAIYSAASLCADEAMANPSGGS